MQAASRWIWPDAIWSHRDGANQIIQSATRPPGGSFSAPVDLSAAGQNAFAPQIAVDGAGNAIAVWQRSDGANTIVQSASRPPGGSFSAPVDLSAAGGEDFEPQVAVDGDGNALAIWVALNGANQIIQAAGYDAAGPQLRSLSIPSGGRVGKRVSFSVSPFDPWSGLGQTVWSFGDGAQASTAQAAHAYAVAGSYPITVTATDVLGNTTSTAGRIVIKGGAGHLPPTSSRSRRARRCCGCAVRELPDAKASPC